MSSLEIIKKAAAAKIPLERIYPIEIAFNAQETPAGGLSARTPVEVSVEPSELLVAAFDVLGLTRLGKRSWSFDAEDSTQVDGVFQSVFETFWVPEAALKDAPKNGALLNTDAYPKGLMQHKNRADIIGRYFGIRPADYPYLSYGFNQKPWSGFAFIIKRVKKRFNIKLVTDKLAFGEFDLDTMPLDSVKAPLVLPAWRALKLRDTLSKEGYPFVDRSVGTSMSDLEVSLGETISVLPIEGEYGRANVILGAQAPGSTGFKAKDTRTLRSEAMSLESLGAVHDRAIAAKGTVHFDEEVRSLLDMGRALPVGRDKLRPYQDLCVSRMKAGNGLLNASAPGLGKTIMTAVGLKEEAEEKDGKHISLIVVPAGMRSQWQCELEVWHPTADVRLITASKDVEKALEDLTEPSDAPRIVIASYEMSTNAVDDLKAFDWDAMVIDEAAILKNPSSKRSKSLWELRSKAAKAFALTGTPIDKSINDAGKILAWVKNEPSAANNSLGKKFPSLAREVERQALRATLGPLMFRRDRSEIADELPAISTEVVRIDPTPAEKALAVAARKELETIYEDLMEKIKEAADLHPTDPKYRKAQDELIAARGAVLGGVTLARMAATDPQAVEDSASNGALLLKAGGYVAKAVKGGGTKRNQLVELTVDLVGRGEKVLLFTDFSSVAKNLLSDLKSRGIKAGSIMGEQSHKSRDEAATGFMGDDYDALVLTSAAQEGLNLQAASVLVHVDLPWQPSAIVQRLGRASRIGSKSKHLSVLIPLMVGTIEERVASVLVPRAMVAMSALDSGRVDVKNTELGMALGGLAEIASSSEADKKDMGILEMAKEILK